MRCGVLHEFVTVSLAACSSNLIGKHSLSLVGQFNDPGSLLRSPAEHGHAGDGRFSRTIVNLMSYFGSIVVS